MSNTAAEIEARIDLACALRSASRMGLGEGICNHFSAEVPGHAGHFLINPQGLHWSEVTPADLITVDAQGNKVAGKHEVEPTAFFIHGAAHRSKPDAKCVLHTHMPYATSLTVVQGGRVEAASQVALKFYGRTAYDENYNGLALDHAEGARIVAGLKNADVLFLANHGIIVTGPAIDVAFDDLYYLERACMLQVLGMGTGKALKLVPDAIARTTAAQMCDDTQAKLHFIALKRLLDRDEPGWSRQE
jgi:ribulose-5-phosphate 4-epimerase/fuculose-1-phosphate aldolase